MKENIVAEKSFAFAVRAVKANQYLVNEKKRVCTFKTISAKRHIHWRKYRRIHWRTI
jgi:hypothetical protein